MSLMASQITSLTIVYSTVHSGAYQRKHESSASLAFVRGIHRGPVNSPHKRPVMRKMFPFDDVIMKVYGWVVPGMAGDFPCHLVDMLSSVSISDLGYTDELMDQLNDYGVLRWVFVVCRNLYPVSSKSFRASLSNMIAADALAPYVAMPEPYWLCKVYVWCFVG